MIAENLEKLFSLKDKIIVMTGAAGGIGRELAKGMLPVHGSWEMFTVSG
mgnify:CR=1 FL=1